MAEGGFKNAESPQNRVGGAEGQVSTRRETPPNLLSVCRDPNISEAWSDWKLQNRMTSNSLKVYWLCPVTHGHSLL
jgi:hypothetical protein